VTVLTAERDEAGGLLAPEGECTKMISVLLARIPTSMDFWGLPLLLFALICFHVWSKEKPCSHDWQDRQVMTDWGYELWRICPRCGQDIPTVEMRLRELERQVAYLSIPRPEYDNNPRCDTCGAVMVPIPNPLASLWKCLSCGSNTPQKEKDGIPKKGQ
jgi:hypothetical protein